MLVLPLVSIAIEARIGRKAVDMPLLAKWFVFWALGVRLALAGIRQIAQPQYTADVVLGLQNNESLLLVRELGFANLAIGSVGLLSLCLPTWRLPAAFVGAAFYGLAGINHLFQLHRNQLENIALASDLYAAVVLASVCIGDRVALWKRL